MIELKDATPTTSTNPFETELVNAIRDHKLVQVPWSELTEEEKRAAHVAMFHQFSW